MKKNVPQNTPVLLLDKTVNARLCLYADRRQLRHETGTDHIIVIDGKLIAWRLVIDSI